MNDENTEQKTDDKNEKKLKQKKLKEEIKKKEEVEIKRLEDEIKKNKQRIKEFNKTKPKNWLDLKGWIIKIKDRLFPNKTFLVHMELRNGMHTQFVIMLKGNCFNYMDGIYVIDDKFKYYDVSSKLYCLDYHQDFSLPIKRKVDLNALRNAIQKEGITDVDTAINPVTLKNFIESAVIQKVMKGEEMDQIFRFLKLMTTLIFIGVVIILIVLLKTTGILESMNIPFL